MTLESSQKGKLSALTLCRHRPAASLHRRDAVIMCEGGKEEAENKRMARRPKRMGKSPVESTAGASCAGVCGAGRVAVLYSVRVLFQLTVNDNWNS